MGLSFPTLLCAITCSNRFDFIWLAFLHPPPKTNNSATRSRAEVGALALWLVGGFLSVSFFCFCVGAHALLPTWVVGRGRPATLLPNAERLLLLAKVEAPVERQLVVTNAACCAGRFGQVLFQPCWGCLGQDAKQRLYNFITWQQCHGCCHDFFFAHHWGDIYVDLWRWALAASAFVCWASVIPPIWVALSPQVCVCWPFVCLPAWLTQPFGCQSSGP